MELEEIHFIEETNTHTFRCVPYVLVHVAQASADYHEKSLMSAHARSEKMEL